MRFLFSLVLFITSLTLTGQDVIVRITGDSLRVKVVSSNDTFVYYHSAETKRGKVDVMARTEIAQVLYGFEDPNRQLAKVTKREKRDYNLMEFWFVYGASFMPNSNIDDGDFQDYQKRLRWGNGFNLGANYFFNSHYGISLLYSSSRFKNSVPVSLGNVGPNSTVAYGDFSDNIKINYIAAGLTLRYNLGESFSTFEVQAGFGVNLFSNEAELVYNFDLKAEGIGYHLIGAANINLGGNLFLPIRLGFHGGNVGNVSFKPNENMPIELRNELEGFYNNEDKSLVNQFSIRAGLLLAF